MSLRRALPLVAALVALATPARAKDAADRCAEDAEAGQTARLAGKLRSARQHLISCATDACPRVVRVDCARWLSEVESEQPSLVVRARDAGGQDVSDVRVFVDGEKVADRADGLPIPVDVGERKLRFERAGSPAVDQSVVFRSGERSRVVTVVIGGADAADATAPPRRSTTGPLLLGGTGVALAIGGGVLWAVGKGAHGDLESSCAPEGLCATSDIDAARTKLIVGDILLGAGVLAVAGAVYWYLSSGSPKRTAAPWMVPTVRF
jgi:hypothetical protein